MADFKTVRRNLPPPPAEAETGNNLAEPEHAPSDGRSARKTGRTMKMGLSVKEEFHHELRKYAADHKLQIVMILEDAFEAWKEKYPIGSRHPLRKG